ncbi:hypothetical protein DXA75_09775 [Thomasclavelia ramosa]|uniref:hypothetical protein n=1 Tax=Thomasclavelia ramosa TaxID=1547 RepID=UPI000E504D81|nr:hypothetical protein [Thomasclavelia ramosa]RGX62695.1 hypothetical protein DXA75_09775 [Thomasclavelia ramosa]
MNIRLFFKNIICLIVILFTALCLTGCRSQNKQVNENIYHVDYDTTVENYISLSDIGIDYLIPRLDDHYWNEYQTIKEESQMAESKDENAQFYLLRNNDVEDENGYMKKLEGWEIIEEIEPLFKQFIGQSKISKQNINYCNDIKYTDVKGTTGDKYYYGVYFQSYCEIPSISIKYIPTAYIIVYENSSDEENIMEMVQDIKEWTLRME